MFATVFALLAHTAWSAQDVAVCANSKNTVELTACMNGQLELKIAKFQKYYLAAQKQDSVVWGSATALIKTQEVWETYLRQHCDSLYRREQGSARFVETAACQLRLYDARIKEIWISHLTYHDATPPVLPDPQP
ncbi:DUF1311 domain-containing protein [Undibacterium sp. CY7W]|uniref:DUF1311 domain-containing protein n=1 Tax=Undibacterium rugosum TaxID=2762291 RepID=A0A923I267_9BURK|nr:lysozyme inhibitor LprI family protein [Undibacterium rugosum]MBC3934046.1 DUF1311 domain-containing protein [Undibacterium rugosum]